MRFESEEQGGWDRKAFRRQLKRELKLGGYRRGRFGHHRWHGERDDGNEGRRRYFESNELRLVLLKLISDQPRHGYDLIRAIEELTSGAYAPSPGVVYPALSILQDMSHIKATEAGQGRNTFAITAEGEAELKDHADKVKVLFARLAELGATRQQAERSPVRRAMENLRMVLRQRLGGDIAKKVQHEVAAILDEAAQRIERL
ncbi:MAG: PadR family transcriptional regulator [Alphaproteobacteria bacterium]|nr:PadR family transcriptional regulator [Alphaproteobacteria bacterium]